MTYTGMVSATRSWIIDPANPTGYRIQCGTRRTTDANITKDGEFRQFAGDRTQMVKYHFTVTTVPIVIAALGRADYSQLKSWIGTVLLLRTIDGQRYFGGYLGMDIHLTLRTSNADGLMYDGSVNFTVVSYTEAV